MSSGLWGDAFSRKYIIWPWPWGQYQTKCCQVPSSSCDLFMLPPMAYNVGEDTLTRNVRDVYVRGQIGCGMSLVQN